MPIRKQHKDFVPRGQSALLGYKSESRPLGVSKPKFDKLTIKDYFNNGKLYATNVVDGHSQETVVDHLNS